MRIGIDFDNTIANYDSVFWRVAIKYKLIKKNWRGNKKLLRRKIIKDKNEEVWKKLQGLVYGKYMHLAELSSGFINFLLKAEILGAKVFLVSHKTVYGHYDKNKIPLRKVALKWIKKKKISHFNKIYFEDTIENKIKRINKLKLNYFIDDLELILKNKKFSNKTKKILLNSNTEKKKLKNINQFIRWSDIRNYIFNVEGLKEIKTYAEFISKKKIIKVKKIVGQKNSQLYQIFYKDGLVAALKKYPPFDFDKRDRLKREFQGLEIMKKNGFKNISKILYYNVNLNIIIFKWLYGKKPVRLDNFDLKQSLNFIKKIKSLSREKVKSFNFDAVESCKSLQDIISQINYKIHDLEKIKSVKLKKFLNSRLKPIYLNLSKKSKLSKMFKMFYQPIKENLEILSPSDFGFHNSIKKSKKIIFIDFEYFGKDDPVKLCADFMLHPGMHLKNEQKKNWLKDIIQIFKIDKYFSRRLRFLLPFYAIRWSLIVLNDFKMKNTNNSYISIKGKKSLLINQANQLKKAIFFCNLVKSEKYKKWLN